MPACAEREQWEQDRLSSTGGGIAYSSIAPDYEEYFETLRRIAGEPASGTTGRLLPKFEKWWVEEFQEVVKARVSWWEGEMRRAREQDTPDKGPSITIQLAGVENRQPL